MLSSTLREKVIFLGNSQAYSEVKSIAGHGDAFHLPSVPLVNAQGQKVNLLYWDVASKFSNYLPTYLKGNSKVIICLDGNDHDIGNTLQNQLKSLQDLDLSPKITVVILGNSDASDLDDIISDNNLSVFRLNEVNKQGLNTLSEFIMGEGYRAYDSSHSYSFKNERPSFTARFLCGVKQAIKEASVNLTKLPTQ